MKTGQAERTAAAVTVVAVSAIAAVQSYNHITDLARAHGQNILDSRLLPLSVDGLILAASLVVLHESRAGRKAPVSAWLMLGLGIAATLGANVTSGLPHGWLNAVISAWPAIAFVGSVETVMRMVRRARSEEPGGYVPSGSLSTVPSSVLEAAKASMAATVAAGNPLSQNQLQERFELNRAQAKAIHTAVLASTNGHQAAT